jgi:hypothetical protein
LNEFWLDPGSQYPSAASRLCGSAGSSLSGRCSISLQILNPTRWPWLAHAAIIARRLKDPPCAPYAEALRTRATGPDIGQAQQMDILLLADMNDWRGPVWT